MRPEGTRNANASLLAERPRADISRYESSVRPPAYRKAGSAITAQAVIHFDPAVHFA